MTTPAPLPDPDQVAPPADPRALDVVVIGAGFAGLTAARALSQQGVAVRVLEARTRIGGRTSTVDVGGARVDEGGAWIDGHRSNPLMELASDAGLSTVRADYIDPLRPAIFDVERGRWLRRVEAIRHLIGSSRIGARLARPSDTDDAHLGERIDRTLGRRTAGTDGHRIRRSLVRDSAESNFADRLEVIGAHAQTIGEMHKGGEAVVVGGYGALTKKIASGLDIRLGHVVTAVRYGARGIAVDTDQGVFEGSHVVVTAPIGVLKAGSITFDPPLPDRKRLAIERMGVGRLEKIVFRFDTAFWRTDPDRARNLFRVADDTSCPMFFDLSEGAGAPMLAALLTGRHSERLVDDPEPLVAEALAALEEMFPGRVERPLAVRTTDWQRDPFTLGSYSTIWPETSEDDFAAMVEPVAGRLLFAGEATSVEHPGYVTGALVSGLREASRLLGRDVALDLTGSTPAATPAGRRGA